MKMALKWLLVAAAVVCTAAVELRQPFVEDRSAAQYTNLFALTCNGELTVLGDGVVTPKAMFQMRSQFLTNLMNGMHRAARMAVQCGCSAKIDKATMDRALPLTGGWFVRGITDGNATGNDPATVLADAGCTAETVDLLRMFRVQRASLLRTPSFAASEAFESGAAAATFALPLSADTRLVLSVQRCPRHDPFRNMFDDESVVVDDELDVFHSAVTLNCVGKCGTLARFCVADDDCAGLGASTCMPLAARLFESESICVEMTVNASLSLAENLVSAVRVTDDVACDSRAAYEAAATQNAVCAVGNGFVPMGFNYTVYKWESKECFQRVCDASGEFRELGSGDKEACPSPCNSACGWDALVLLDGVNCLEVSTAVELKPLMDDIGDSFNGEVCVPHNARVRFPLRVADGGVLGDSWRAANIVPTALQLLAELVTANNRYRMSDSGREALIADWKQWLARGSDGVATGGGDIGVCMFPHAAQRAAVNLVPGDVAFEHTAADGVKSALSGVQFASTLLWSALDAPTHNCTLVADEGAAVPHRVVCADPRKPSSADNDLLRYARDATTATAADTAVDPFWALVDEGVWANVTDVKYGGGDDRNYVTLLATTCGWSSWLAFPGTFLETQVNVPGAAMLYQRAMRAAARLLDDRMYALRDTVFAGYTRAAVRESAVAALLPYSLHYVALNYFIDDYSEIGIDEPNFVFGKQAAQLLRQPGDIWSLLRDAADGNKPVAFLGDALAERLRRAVDWSAVFTAKPFVSFQLSLMNDYPDFPYGIAISAQACGGGRAALPELQVGLTGAHPDAFNLRGCDIGTVCPDTLYGKGKCTRYDELYDWWGQLSTVATNEIEIHYNKEGTFFQAKHLGIETTTMAKTIAYRPVLRSIIDTLIAPVMNFTRPWFDYDEFVRLLQVQTQSATRCTRAEDEWEGMEGARDMFVELVRSVVPPARRSIARGNQIGVCVPDLDLVTSALGLNGSPLELIKAAEIDEATRLKMEQAKAAEAAAALKTLVQPPPAPQRGKRELSYDDPDSFAPTVEPYTPPPRVARNDNGILLRCMPFADTALDAEPGHEDEQFKPCAGRASPASATQEDVNSGSFSKPVMWLLIALAIACCVALLLLLLAFLLVRRHRSRQQAEQRRQPSPDGDGRRTPRSRNPRRRTGRAAVGDTARHATGSDHDAAAAAYYPPPQFDASGNLIMPPGMVPMSVRAADGTVMMILVPAHLAEATATKSAAAAGAGATGAAAAASSNGTLAMASSVPSGSGGTRTTAPFITDGELARTVAASSAAGSTRDASAYGDMPMDDADTIMNDGSGSAQTFASMQRANSVGQLPPVWAADPGDAMRQQRTQYGAPPLAQPPAQW